MKSTISTSQAKKMITDKLSHFFGVSPADATDEQFYKAQAIGLSDGHLYKLAGNAVSVPVITAIGKKIKEINDRYGIVK